MELGSRRRLERTRNLEGVRESDRDNRSPKSQFDRFIIELENGNKWRITLDNDSTKNMSLERLVEKLKSES